MGKEDDDRPEQDEDLIAAIDRHCQEYGLTELERLQLVDLIASHVIDPESPPLTITDAIQMVLNNRDQSPNHD